MLTSTIRSPSRQTATCMPTSGLPANARRAAASTMPSTSLTTVTGASAQPRGSATSGSRVGLQPPAVQLEVGGVGDARHQAEDLGDLVAGQPGRAERPPLRDVQLGPVADHDRRLDALAPGLVGHAVDA